MKMVYVGDNRRKSFSVNSKSELVSYKYIGFSDIDIKNISDLICDEEVIYWSDTPPWNPEDKISWSVDKDKLIDHINKIS